MLTVMIVDDMEITRREIKRLPLWGEKTGFLVSDEAKNGYEALAKLEKNPVDLVITDIKMPKIDGIELLRKIVEKNLCSCVVLLSDFTEFSFARQGLILGAFDYMTKPVAENELNQLLQRAGQFIINRRKEEDRIKKLEETVDEKVGVFFPAADIKRLTALICEGDGKALGAAEEIVDIIGANVNHDLIKVQSVLKNGMLEMVNGVLESCKWLDKFVTTDRFINVDFSQCDRFESIKTAFIAAVQEIITLLNTLQCGMQSGGIVRSVCSYVIENVESELSLKIVAEALFMNKTYISEVFKQKTGMSFVNYLTRVKMERAKQMIQEENLRAYEIAEKLGFKDIEYFSKLFKKHTGCSPTEFRQMNAGKD